MNTIFDRLIGFKRVLLCAALVCAVIFGVVLMDPLSVHAEESQFSYVINTVEYNTRYGTPIRITKQYTIESPVPLAFLKVGDTNVNVNFDLEYGSRPAYRLASLSGTPVQATVRTSELLSGNIPDSSYTTSETWLYTQLPGSSYFNCAEFSCNIPRYSNEEALNHYLGTNDYSGADNIDEVDPHYKDRYSGIKHEFSDDDYFEDIPVPMLSNVSHNGFTVDNSSDDLYLDIICESSLHGVQHLKIGSSILSGDTYDFCPALWTYSSHYFNFSDCSDLAVNNHVIDLPSIYGIDNADLLSEDFKNWSRDYPDHTYLRDYDKKLHRDWSLSGKYKMFFTYDSSSPAYDQMLGSGQGFTNFYVRFYDSDMHYGQWILYTYNYQYINDPNASLKDGLSSVSVSKLNQGEGLPYWGMIAEGSQDSNGSLTLKPYNPWNSGSSFLGKSLDDLDVSSLFGVLTNLVSAMGVVPTIISQVFSFFPTWLISMIFVGIGALIIFRILGR